MNACFPMMSISSWGSLGTGSANAMMGICCRCCLVIDGTQVLEYWGAEFVGQDGRTAHANTTSLLINRCVCSFHGYIWVYVCES